MSYLHLCDSFETLCLGGEIINATKAQRHQVSQSQIINKSNRTSGYRIFIFVLSGFLILFSSCEKILLNNPGKQVTLYKVITPFSRITIYDIFNVELKSDSIYSFKLSGYTDYLENISLVIDSGILKISDHNKYKWLADYPRTKITIGFPEIDAINLKAPVHIISLDTLKLENFLLISWEKTAEINLIMDLNYFEFWTTTFDFGYYLFKGKVKSCGLWHKGAGIVDASGLESEICQIHNYSIGNSYVNVTRKLEVYLNSSGNIFYTGNPKEIIIAEQSNKGKLIRLSK